MFDHLHYVPILRWKRGEWVALRELSEDTRGTLTPLIEITPRSFAPRRSGVASTASDALSKIAQDLVSNWGRRRAFIDFWLLPPDLHTGSGCHSLLYFVQEAMRLGASITPVTGLGRARQYQGAAASAMARGGCGVCIRLLRGDLNRPSLAADLDTLLAQLGAGRDQADMLVDLQYIGDAVPDWSRIIRRVPYRDQWRTFTVGAGAFPVDLTALTVGVHSLRRSDWLAWRALADETSAHGRRPTFADYSIQHGVYTEPPEGANVSASIRYTSQESWVVIRGQGLRNENGPGSAQYHSEAQWLCRQSGVFCGNNFSYGDGYIHERAVVTDPPGSPETLLRAGFNHHLTFVVRQIATLFGT